uniref:GIR1-like zinc ribbon domain-containing protein n=2 Tax=Rhizophora mucronata TaxID=61149 RepID=A0A2P2IPI3_RHIMU
MMTEKLQAKSGKLNFEMSLSPCSSSSSTNNVKVSSPDTSVSSVEMSPAESSCLSWEPPEEAVNHPSRPEEEATSMLLVGCPRCLMYVLLSKVNPKCPQCKSTVLLDFVNEFGTKKTTCRQ